MEKPQRLPPRRCCAGVEGLLMGPGALLRQRMRQHTSCALGRGSNGAKHGERMHGSSSGARTMQYREMALKKKKDKICQRRFGGALQVLSTRARALVGKSSGSLRPLPGGCSQILLHPWQARGRTSLGTSSLATRGGRQQLQPRMLSAKEKPSAH